MRVILFQDRFAKLVLAGTKRQTIRKAARCKPGDELSLRRWTGKPYRSNQEIIRVETCKSVEPVIIREGMSVEELIALDRVATADGFGDALAMLAWFEKTHGLPFEGEIVKW